MISKAAGPVGLRFSPRARKKMRTFVHFRTAPLDAIVQFSVMGGPFSVTSTPALLTPSFQRSPGPGGEGDSFGLQGGGSCLRQADFNRGLSAALRSRLPLRKHTGCPRENSVPPGFLIHRPPRRAMLARKNWGRASLEILLKRGSICGKV